MPHHEDLWRNGVLSLTARDWNFTCTFARIIHIWRRWVGFGFGSQKIISASAVKSCLPLIAKFAPQVFQLAVQTVAASQRFITCFIKTFISFTHKYEETDRQFALNILQSLPFDKKPKKLSRLFAFGARSPVNHRSVSPLYSPLRPVTTVTSWTVRVLWVFTFVEILGQDVWSATVIFTVALTLSSSDVLHIELWPFVSPAQNQAFANSYVFVYRRFREGK